jgi:hypothetical protein
VTNGDRDRAQDVGLALEATANCLPFERLDQELTSPEREHVASCPRCQTELALWEAMNAATQAREESSAVQWVVAEVKRRRSAPAGGSASASLWGWVRLRGLAAAAATLVVGVVVGYVAWDREPGVRDPGDTRQEYRTERMEVVGPVGDVPGAPTELAWKSYPGAVRYDVSLLEVDRTVLWRGSSTTPRVGLPREVSARFAPGKTVVWEVSARDASGSVIAETGTLRFRVAIGSSPQGE